MQTDLQTKLSRLEDVIKIQRECLEKGYMHGMLNGLICAHSIFSGLSPAYVSKTRSSKSNVRHKSRKRYK